ncbi:MAG TPA: tRNA pseudouridine(38-40) synthase TruA [Vicinamibacterales bacterium]|nr:tRNA pseudouridine(38-40) synthase TruA [Vicinamibacterales bacterium]
MPNFRITVAYDGGPFVGWQRQAEGASIQGLIEDALVDLEGGDVTVTGAGRTDAGVHAFAQVANFTLTRDIAPDVIVRSLNAKLPIEIRVRSADLVPPSFHARFDATAKSYRYRLWNAEVLNPFEHAYVWHVTTPLDVALMADAARLLEGRHDFAAFQAVGGTPGPTDRLITQSTLSASGDGLLTYDVTGDGFLRHMVRAIVGTLVDVGRGRQRPEWILDVIASRDRAQAGRTAPANGLFLVRVDYGDVQFGAHVP